METEATVRTVSAARPWVPKAVYFFNYAARAALAPFLVLYYEQIDLSGREVGFLIGLPPLLALVAAPLVSGIADATGRHKTILLGIIAGAAVTVLFFPLVQSFALLIPLVILYALCMEPAMPLTDKAVIDWLGERKAEYGRQRLWGAVGWGVAAPLAGWLVDWGGLHWSFWGFVTLMGGVFFATVRLPVDQIAAADHLGWGLRRFLQDRRWRLFLVLGYVAGVGMSLVHHYFFLYLERLGASSTLMGIALTVATVSELVVMPATAGWIRRWGTIPLLLTATAIFALRLGGYAVVDHPALALALQLLHGPSFALLWVAGVAHADAIAPRGLGTTAQGLFSAVVFGVGGFTGALLGGFLYESMGVAAMYGWVGLGLMGVLVFLAPLAWRMR